ncbi:MAG: hypothetical protein ACQESR_27965 [Planctomycetota bacterium]
MYRRLCLSLVVIVSASSGYAGEASDEVARATQRIDTVNYVLGTQTFGVKYKFTEKTSLVETATRIHEMGSNILKFSMSRRCLGGQYDLPKRADIDSLVELAREEHSVRRVLEMPFAYYHIWTYPFAHSAAAWRDGLSETERGEAYEEVHALARYLLDTYRGTGKTFFLGHWEGDWYLHPGYDRAHEPSPTAIRGMIDWLNVRQKAVDDAKRLSAARGVNVYHYTEVNLVQKGMQGGTCLVNDVLPHTEVDYVSYSSYDTVIPHKGNVKHALHAALDYIESQLPPKESISGKRVFIGEFGFPVTLTKTAEKQDRYARDVCLAALEWGCPFVLYWQMYCNEKQDGEHRGFWLIDDKNQKQPFYFTLRRYFEDMTRFVRRFKSEHGRVPTAGELRERAIEILKGNGSDS